MLHRIRRRDNNIIISRIIESIRTNEVKLLEILTKEQFKKESYKMEE